MKIVQEEPQKLKTDYEIVAPVKQEYKKVGSINLKRGMTLYEFDFKTLVLKPVQIDRRQAMVDINGRPVKNARATYNPNALYIQALNVNYPQAKDLWVVYFIMAFLTYTHQHCIKLQKRGDTTPLSHLPICSRLNIYAALQAS